jgi:hypothetical protein
VSFLFTIMRALSFGLLVLCCGVGSVVAAADAEAKVNRVVQAVGGEDKLLKLFRIEEIYHFGDQPEPAEGKKRSTRESVLEMPGLWWLKGKERADEPAKFDVWAWTLGILVDPKAKVEAISDKEDGGKALFGLRVSAVVDPAMDLYFDPDSSLLTRLDWRGDIYRFSDWKEHDGVKYASRTIIFKAASGKPWFFHEVTAVERLAALPEGVVRPVTGKPE